MKITFKKSGGITIIVADATPVGQIRAAHRTGDFVLSFRHICWSSRSRYKVFVQISFLGLSTLDSDQKLRPQPYGQSCIHVRSLKLTKYIAEQVAMGYPHILFGRKL